LIDTF